MVEFAPFIAFFGVFVTLVTWLTMKSRAEARLRVEHLVAMGFAHCKDEAENLAQTVAWVEHNREYDFTVDDPLRLDIDDLTVYHYTKNRCRQGYTVAEDEVLVPLERRSQEGLVLFIKPNGLGHDTRAHMIGAMATGAWDSHPDDLVELRMPPEPRSNIIEALGPPNTSIYDLMDQWQLEVLQDVGDYGAMIVVCRGNWCSFASHDVHMPLDVDKLLPTLRRLMKGPELADSAIR